MQSLTPLGAVTVGFCVPPPVSGANTAAEGAAAASLFNGLLAAALGSRPPPNPLLRIDLTGLSSASDYVADTDPQAMDDPFSCPKEEALYYAHRSLGVDKKGKGTADLSVDGSNNNGVIGNVPIVALPTRIVQPPPLPAAVSEEGENTAVKTAASAADAANNGVTLRVTLYHSHDANDGDQSHNQSSAASRPLSAQPLRLTAAEEEHITFDKDFSASFGALLAHFNSNNNNNKESSWGSAVVDSEAVAAASRHPFVFVEEEGASSRHDASAAEAVLASSLVAALAAAVHQSIFSLNVRRVRSEVTRLIEAATTTTTTTSSGSFPAPLLIPLASFGPALLLATRACCRPRTAAESNSESSSSCPPPIGRRVCAGGCGNAPHDLISRAYMMPMNSHESVRDGDASAPFCDDTIAVEIPLDGSAASFPYSREGNNYGNTSKAVVCHERDYVFGVVHTGHRRGDVASDSAEPPSPTPSPSSLASSFHLALSDFVAASAIPSMIASVSSTSTVAASTAEGSKAKVVAAAAVNRSKGYALQTHVKGLNFILRMMSPEDLSSSSDSSSAAVDNGSNSGGDLPPFAYGAGCCALATAALASRESSTHANQFVPPAGVRLVAPRALVSVWGGNGGGGEAAEGSSPLLIDPAAPVPLALTRGGHTGVSTGALSATANPLAQKAVCFDIIGRLVSVSGAGTVGGSAKNAQKNEKAKEKEEESENTAADASVAAATTTAMVTTLSTLDFVRPPPQRGNSSADADAKKAERRERNLRDVATADLRTPIIVVSGTSAEAGKSTLAKKIMRALMRCDRNAFLAKAAADRTPQQRAARHDEPTTKGEEKESEKSQQASQHQRRPLRVAYVKATGTSSWGDTIHAQRVGVFAAYDQLDCGLPTTYARGDTVPLRRQKRRLQNVDDKEEETNYNNNNNTNNNNNNSSEEEAVLDQLAQLSLSFLHAQSDGADVIVTELGGDIIFAKNPQILAQQWLWSNVFRCFVIGNDSMATIGVIHFLGLSGSVCFEGLKATEKEEKEESSSSSSSLSHYSAILASAVPFPIQFVASPFRTFDGAVSRAAVLGLPPVMNPNAPIEDLIDLLTVKSR